MEHVANFLLTGPLDLSDVSPALSLQYCERAYGQSRGNFYWTKVLYIWPKGPIVGPLPQRYTPYHACGTGQAARITVECWRLRGMTPWCGALLIGQYPGKEI